MSKKKFVNNILQDFLCVKPSLPRFCFSGFQLENNWFLQCLVEKQDDVHEVEATKRNGIPNHGKKCQFPDLLKNSV